MPKATLPATVMSESARRRCPARRHHEREEVARRAGKQRASSPACFSVVDDMGVMASAIGQKRPASADHVQEVMTSLTNGAAPKGRRT
jgi:hypothetical protein